MEEPETSQFESSDMLATYLASTPLLEETWKRCNVANAVAQRCFTVDRVGEVAYVAFSGVQEITAAEESSWRLVELESGGGDGIFGAFGKRDEPVMVHSGLLQLFSYFYHTHNFEHKMPVILNECKSVIFTGHSLGGAIASLSALWLLSYIQTNSLSKTVICITYGSPLIGNESFSQAILQQRWAGNFCHMVSQHDILPRLLFAPPSLNAHLNALFQFWHSWMTAPAFVQLAPPMLDENKAEVFQTVLACLGARCREGDREGSPYTPFGSYMFCTESGAICLDNRNAIVAMLYLTLAKGSAISCVEDHLKYGDYVGKVCGEYFRKSSFMEGCSPESSNDAGIALALNSSGISYQEPVYGTAKNCLAVARHIGCSRNINNARMAVKLSKITPYRAQIEWYKAYCDNSEDQFGYYDDFKLRGASKRGPKVNIIRIKLGEFWDDLISKMEANQLTHDFHKMPKYVNASQFYKLLVEPLEIAEYYRTGEHKRKGHYIEHGREKRFKIFDKWWKDRKVGDEESKPRSKFASSTQDSCFWARVEEARDCIYCFYRESDSGNRQLLLEKIEKFEQYASAMVEKKEVSIDVLAKNSSYNVFRKEWGDLRSQLHDLHQLPSHFPDFQDRMVL